MFITPIITDHIEKPRVEEVRDISSFQNQTGTGMKSGSNAAMCKLIADTVVPNIYLPMGKYVGELHEKWNFPSDHLPIGMTADGMGVLSWNVLNNCYLEKWMYELDSQKLNGSLITQLDNVIDEVTGLTERDVYIVDLLLESLEGKDFVCLQECGAPFLLHLKEHLSNEWDIIFSSSPEVVDQNVILYRKLEYSFCKNISHCDEHIFPDFPSNSLMRVVFQKSDGKLIQIFNTHLPGDPLANARSEFAEFVTKHTKTTDITIATGDMNFNEWQMDKAFQTYTTGYTRLSPYPTNVSPWSFDPPLMSKAIDHFFVFGCDDIEMIDPEQLIKGTVETLSLLN
ncbi:MAG: hypothetical protein P0S94_01815 [Simkaniaceae bacterium]|nr:hypothetical protein [Simkaniaceae bacterium]